MDPFSAKVISRDISASDSPPAYSSSSNFRTTFTSLSLHRTDRIRLIQFPQSDIAGLRELIIANYPFGLSGEQKYGVSHEFKLNSRPWLGQGSDAIPSRILMREILAHLYRSGWIIHCSTDCSKKAFDKDTLFFRKQPSPPPESEWISISFNMADRMRLIGADEVLIAATKQLLQSMGLLQDESWKDRKLQAKEFKIYGTPWIANGEETMTTRLLLLRLLEVLENHGWSLYASIDQSQAGQGNASETDSWYCVRDKAWVPGGHVFHH